MVGKTIINNVAFDVFITKDVEILDKNNNSFLLKERLSEKEMKRYFNCFFVESDNSITFQVNKEIRMNELKTKKLEINFKTDILKITKAGKGGIKNESES